jgi:uncharacterized Zn finger protein
MSYWGYPPYVSVAERREQALKEIAKLKKKGVAIRPIEIEGRKIARNFWGKAWCDNLERYSDYANRLPRGRSYVCNGSVIDLKIERGKVEALVNGSSLYKVKIEIAVAASQRWKAICADCAGSVGSLIELLQGKLSKNVMERVCRAADGLFPGPREIKLSCSCPDSATMCKHVAATLYGVGARLDSDPDLLFQLRGVDRAELITEVADLPLTRTAAASDRVLADDDVAALFGLEMEAPVESAVKATSVETGRARALEKAASAPKARASKSKPPSRAAPPPAIVAPAPELKKGKHAAPSEPAPPLAVSKRLPARFVAPASAVSTTSAPRAAKSRRFEPPPVGRTRAAKWIGARKLKTEK